MALDWIGRLNNKLEENTKDSVESKREEKMSPFLIESKK